MMALLQNDSENVTPSENRQSSKEDEIDLEDGEIEDDEEEVPQPAVIPKPVPPKIEPPIIKAPIKEVLPIVKVDKVSKKKSKKIGVIKPGLNEVNKAAGEDDWADNVEKAIRAAMGGEVKELDENGEEDDGEDRKRKKKRKKRHRGEEEGDDRKDSKRRKKHHRTAEDEGAEEDDDEMLFVRGASPIMREHDGQSPPYQPDQYLYTDEMRPFVDYSSYEDESEDDFMDGGGGGGGGGRGGRGRGRGRGGRGGGRGGRKMIRGREPMKKRRPQRGDQRQGPDSVCMFFMQGKCQKGDECPYSHDAMPPRKMELCKFYLMDCCAKKDKCLYMHHDFPCKYHHTGLKCFAGDRCKFNHGILTEVLKSILLRHLETAPKEILGDFPRLTREGAAQMVQDKKSRETAATSTTAVPTTAAKPIPSLFDIEVAMPASMMDREGSPRRDTPMPSEEEAETEEPAAKETRSPSKRHKNRWDAGDDVSPDMDKAKTFAKLSLRQVHEEKKMRWDEEIRKQLEETQKMAAEEKSTEKTEEEVDAKKKRRAEKEQNKKQRREEKKERRREEREERKWDHEERERLAKSASGDLTEGGDGRESFARQDFSQQLDQMRQRQESAESTQKSRLLKLAGYAGADHEERQSVEDRDDKEGLVMDVDDRDTADRKQSVDESALVIDAPDEEDEDKEGTGRDGDKSEDAAADIPAHLPRKQQELFLRIQQQQALREESLKAAAAEEAADKDDEDWYSSDDEAEQSSLSTVLKNLSNNQKTDDELKKKVEDLTKIADVSDAVNKLLSSIGMRQESVPAALASPPIPTTVPLGRLELPMPPAPMARDPRSAARDPRKRPSSEDQRSPSLYDTAKPRSDPRSRTTRRTSSSAAASTAPSIYSSIVLPDVESRADPARDVDLRLKDVDLRTSLKDLDLRTQAFGDLDLRIRPDGGAPDLRQMLGGLPFKPVPAHEAATEIDAGVHSHPPMAYRVLVVTVPPPDYSKLRLSAAEPMVRTDPRLRRLFNIASSSPASPPPASPPPPAAPRADPRRLANQSRDSDPVPTPEPEFNPNFQRPGFPSPLGGAPYIQGPMGPGPGLIGPGTGLLGPAPMMGNFQGTSRYDEGPDTDLRHFYAGGKMGGDWNEQAQWEAQQMQMQQEMHMHQMQQAQMEHQHSRRRGNRDWRENRPSRQRNRNDRGGHGNRSYTPPM